MDSTYKIYYNHDGWVCKRFPENFEIDDENRYLGVDKATWEKTMYCSMGYAWRVVDGELKLDQYGTIPSSIEVEQLKTKLAETDYQAIKYAEGWISEEVYAPIRAQRQAWRDRINELENS